MPLILSVRPEAQLLSRSERQCRPLTLPVAVSFGIGQGTISMVPLGRGSASYVEAGKPRYLLSACISCQCEYDRDNPDETCRYCRERSLTCGSKLNAQEFSRQGRRKRRCTRDLSTSYKNYTWQQVEKGKLSDLVMFVESRCPGKSLEDNLAIAVELVSQLQCSEGPLLHLSFNSPQGNLTAEAALNKSVKFLEESTVVPVSMCHSFSLSQEWAVAADTSSNPPYCLGI